MVKIATLDQQLGLVNESTFNTPVVVTKFLEMEPGSNIEPIADRTEGDALRPSQWVARSDRFTPIPTDHAEGHIDFAVLSKTFGYLLKHMLGNVATTGPVETAAYTHTGTVAALFGTSFTMQITKPFYPSGTVQAVTISGGKIPKWSIKNSVDGNLMLGIDVWGASYTTATATATASYTTLQEPLSWAGGVISIGGSSYDVTDFEVDFDNGLDLERQFIRANTTPKEPGDGLRSGTFSYTSDFDALTQHNRVIGATAATTGPQIIALWDGPSLIVGASTLKPRLTVTIPFARHDAITAANAAAAGIKQTVTGSIKWDGTNSPITVAFQTADVTP